jgi:hypothetical protein
VEEKPMQGILDWCGKLDKRKSLKIESIADCQLPIAD